MQGAREGQGTGALALSSNLEVGQSWTWWCHLMLGRPLLALSPTPFLKQQVRHSHRAFPSLANTHSTCPLDTSLSVIQSSAYTSLPQKAFHGPPSEGATLPVSIRPLSFVMCLHRLFMPCPWGNIPRPQWVQTVPTPSYAMFFPVHTYNSAWLY